MDSNSGPKLVKTDIIALISTLIDDSKLHIQQPSIQTKRTPHNTYSKLNTVRTQKTEKNDEMVVAVGLKIKSQKLSKSEKAHNRRRAEEPEHATISRQSMELQRWCSGPLIFGLA
jgi:hypothetical protein